MLEFLYRSRTRANTLAVGVVLFIVVFERFFPESASGVVRTVGAVAIGVFVLGIVISIIGNRKLPTPDAVRVASPVSGRWLAMNSPASKVPSHGTRAYGQAYAIDLVFEPGQEDDFLRPEFASGAAFRPSTDYPAFGKPVLAMVSGTVVRASDGQRDHHARARIWAVLYMSLEGLVRDIGGAKFVIGNHVVIRSEDGVYALVAHLQRGSVAVKKGDLVEVGQIIGLCGNSGNSSEPHVHAQVMDRPSPSRAMGVPISFEGIQVEPAAPSADTGSDAPNPGGNPDVSGNSQTTDSTTMPANGEYLLA